MIPLKVTKDPNAPYKTPEEVEADAIAGWSMDTARVANKIRESVLAQNTGQGCAFQRPLGFCT
jgi:hypothetical protein